MPRHFHEPNSRSLRVVLPLLLCLIGPGCTDEPRSELDADRGVATDTLRVLAYNIHHGEGMDGKIDLGRIADLIVTLDPDLVALQEVDRLVERTGGVDQAEELGRLTDLTPVFGAFMQYQGGEYGMAVLSRWHIVEANNIRLPDGDEPRTSLSVRVRSPETGQDVIFTGIHFYRTEEERLAQAQQTVEKLELEEAPVILAGDFNSEPGSAVMEMMSRDWEILNKGDDRLTFPSFAPDREIDFIMVRAESGLEAVSHRVLDESIISDHRPIFAELVLRSTDVN